MEGFSVTSERIARTGGALDDVGATLGREIASMHDILGQIRAGWQSTTAAPRFAAQMAGYLEEVDVLRSALLSHGASLVATAQSFDQAEAAIAESMGAAR